MEVKQIYSLVNDITSEVLGTEGLLQEDLSNVVEVGDAIFDADKVDAYVKSLVNRIGKVIFVNRVYNGSAPSVLMDGWEYGSVMQKLTCELPEATENESWALTSGTSYDPNVFTSPTVTAKFYNKKVTFEIPMSFTTMQVKQSFASATELNAFISMIETAIDKSMTIKLDELIMRTVDNMIGETVYSEMSDGTYTGKSGVKAINLLYLYNQRFGTSLKAAEAITFPEFIRFAAYEMGLVASRMSKVSSLFNIGGKDRFTPSDMLHVVTLAEFGNAANAYLQSDTFHNEFTALPKAETVPFWQGSGETYDFADTSKIKIKTASGHEVEFGGILGVMFDREALGVCNMDRRTTTYYNPKAEFYNNWYKMDAMYFNDTNENTVVFYVA